MGQNVKICLLYADSKNNIKYIESTTPRNKSKCNFT